MFSSIGNFANKYKFFILAGWVLLTVILLIVAPSLSEVGVTDQSQFLPEDTESTQADNLLNTKFADVSQDASSAIIVVYNENGLNQEDFDQTRNIRDWLNSSAAPEAVSSTTSIFDSDALRSSLISQDGTTMMMTVELSVPALDDAAKQAIQEIRAKMSQSSGTTFYLTGQAGLLYDQFDSTQKAIDQTTLATIILVIVLLLLVYRAPLAPLVPLFAIGCSFLVARGIIGLIAQTGVAVPTSSDAFLVVTIFGVGTDYCLFMISRFREGLGKTDGKKLTASTMQHIGPIIAASAITVIIAFLCLTISRFGMSRTSGWTLALGIVVTLLAGLTLVPALLSIFRKYLFWPAKRVAAQKSNRFSWEEIGHWIARHPVMTAIPIIVILVIPYFALPKLTLSANVLDQLSEDVESTRGITIVREHFPVGELSPLYLVIQSPTGSLLTEDSLQAISQVSRSLESVEGISRVDYCSAPKDQLVSLGANIQRLGSELTEGNLPLAELASFESMSGDLQDMVLRFPGIVQSANFKNALDCLTQLSMMADQLSSAQPADLSVLLPQTQNLLNNLGSAMISLGNEFGLQGDSQFVDWLKATYFSTDGTIAKMDLILSTDPYSDSAMAAVDEVREAATIAVNSSGLRDTNHYIGGETASYSDILETSNTDFIRIMIITSIGILLVIIILLRSILAPLYMVLTVLLNFGTTLGITTWLFLSVMKGNNLIHMLPVFLFVVLVAVGADYNIFLVSRIREEARNKPIKEAVKQAVAHTGGVITSCGIILAGTFATLATSSLPMVLQIGVPIAIGVIIDTFLVRALLVPSLVVLTGRWSWWPSSLSRKKNATKENVRS